ncbi:hypothetical protein SAMN03159341_108233 [Paenibacillus sp. 1_12]|uniref:hypothetical protein n=1 Tax=Paenibacillus sp. 1_12 TaxID=1566278 RepID=UPI0008E045B4|nr:hypothetical protein [Paenibacillus sp. 1_12]SFL68996.1 hypothetical protein SAMN03159341_108233 [Paenibacillus sp. 1_12]
MKPALEKFLLIAATLAAIGLFIFVAMWSSIKDKKTQMDDLFNNTNVPSSFINTPAIARGGIREGIHRYLYADTEHSENTPLLHSAFHIPSDSIPA